MGLNHTWNHMKSIYKHPCNNGTVALYAESALIAAGAAAMDLLSFGCREPLKHAAGRGQVADWFGRSNQRGFPMPHRRPKGPLGKVVMPGVRAGSWAAWALDAAAERALFYWFLFELGQEFAINWTSLVYAETGCGGPAAGHCVFQITPQVVGETPTDLLLFPQPECHGILFDARHWYLPSGLQATTSYSIKTQPWPPQPSPGATCNSFIFAEEAGEAYGGSQYDPAQNTGNGLVGHADRISGGLFGYKKLSIRAQSGGGIIWIPEGKVHVTLEGSQVKLFPMQDCFRYGTKPGFNDPLTGQRGPRG